MSPTRKVDVRSVTFSCASAELPPPISAPLAVRRRNVAAICALDHDGLGLNLSSVVMTIRTLPLQGNEDHPRTTHTGVLGQCRDGAVDGA